MQQTYKIVQFNASTGQLVVEWHPDFPRVSIDLPIDVNNKYPEGQDLETYISGFVPVWELERMEKLKSVVNTDAILALLPPDAVVIEEPQNNLSGL